MYSFANALNYIGRTNEARIVKNFAEKVSMLSLENQFRFLTNLVHKKMKKVSPKQKKHNLKNGTMEQLLSAAKTEDLMIIVPKGRGKSTTHAVTICRGLVFDSTQKYPLTVSAETFNFVAGSTGFEKVYMSRSFTLD